MPGPLARYLQLLELARTFRADHYLSTLEKCEMSRLKNNLSRFPDQVQSDAVDNQFGWCQEKE